jgi:hypothetical protein
MNVWVTQADIIEELTDLGIDTTDWEAGSYAKLNKEILRTQRRFESLTKRKYEKDDHTELLNGSGKDLLVLSYYPINSIDYIKIKDKYGGITPLTAAEYRVDESTGRVKLISVEPFKFDAEMVFPEDYLNLEAKYNYGYEVADIPEDIKDAIKYMTMINVITRTPADFQKQGLKSLRIAHYQEAYASPSQGIYKVQLDTWGDYIREVINRYRRTPVF